MSDLKKYAPKSATVVLARKKERHVFLKEQMGVKGTVRGVLGYEIHHKGNVDWKDKETFENEYFLLDVGSDLL